jgi:hypothetical protein
VTIFSAHPLDPLYESGSHAQADADPSSVALEALLPALAGLLRETVSRFEDTAGRVSDLVIRQREQANLDLIVALQDFDRLHQEFSALGDALFRYIAAVSPVITSSRTIQDDIARHEVVSGILLEDVKQRLLRRLKHDTPPLAPLDFDEREF